MITLMYPSIPVHIEHKTCFDHFVAWTYIRTNKVLHSGHITGYIKLYCCVNRPRKVWQLLKSHMYSWPIQNNTHSIVIVTARPLPCCWSHENVSLLTHPVSVNGTSKHTICIQTGPSQERKGPHSQSKIMQIRHWWLNMYMVWVFKILSSFDIVNTPTTRDEKCGTLGALRV